MNTDAELRAFVLSVIAERTMPREFSIPNEDWLITLHQAIENSKAVEGLVNHLQSQIDRLILRLDMLEKRT